MLVKKNLDELEANESDMMGVEDIDSHNIDTIIYRTLPQAINIIHQNTDPTLLEGLRLHNFREVSINQGVVTIKLVGEVMYVIKFRAEDSKITLNGAVPEVSTLGRMQLNPYTQGTYDNPCLVISQGKVDDGTGNREQSEDLTELKYYTLTKSYADPAQAIAVLEYLPLYKTAEKAYYISDSIVDRVIDQLTGMVLTILGHDNSANFYLQRALGTPAVTE